MKENDVADLRTAVQDARKQLETKAIDARTNDADGAYMDACQILDQVLAAHPGSTSAPQPVDREALIKTIDKAGSLKVGGTLWPLDRENVREIADAVLALINGSETPDDEQPRMTAENYYCPPASLDGED